MQPILSVIIPVYKTPEDLLRGALESVLRSSVRELEVICVDDSPGAESSVVLREIVAADKRVRLLVNDCNRGVSYSRNRGLKVARGEFVAFHDADDRVVPDGYERVIKFMRKEHLQAARAAHWNDTRIYCNTLPGEAVCASTEQGPEEALLRVVSWFGWTVWGGVYERAALQHVAFNERLTRYEDSLFNADLMASLERVGCLNVPFYRIYAHPNSLSRRSVGEREYLEFAFAAKAFVRVVGRLQMGRHSLLPKYFSVRCFHVLFSDRRFWRVVKASEARRIFAERACFAATQLSAYVSWSMRLTLGVVRFCPMALFYSCGFLPGCLKLALNRQRI